MIKQVTWLNISASGIHFEFHPLLRVEVFNLMVFAPSFTTFYKQCKNEQQKSYFNAQII